MPTRRGFLGTGASAVGAVTALSGTSFVPRALLATPGNALEPILSIQDPRVKTFVQHALDAARGAGATYADVRLTYTKERTFSYSHRMSDRDLPFEAEWLGAGVRVLIDGYWGFASSPVWSRDEMARLGREAARQAKVNRLSKPREILWSPTPPVQGHWETPVKIDAFTVHPVEARDHLNGLEEEMCLLLAKMSKFGVGRGNNVRGERQRARGNLVARFTIQEKAFGSTEGSYVTQRLHHSEGQCWCRGQGIGAYSVLEGNAGARTSLAGIGWEMFDRVRLLEVIREQIDASASNVRLPGKPIDIGRYPTVFDAGSVASLLSKTIGAATEIDRALGYEANAGGTSYLNAPEDMLGSFALGSEHLTVTANRNEPGGAATTRWDDEGVLPDAFPLVRNGVLQDFQTSREGSGWLREPYTRVGAPARSHGGLFAESGQVLPMVHTANLVMQPSNESVTVRELEAQMGAGISIEGAAPSIDFQLTGGLVANSGFVAWEVKNGKRVAKLDNAGLLFKTTELWKNIMAVGGVPGAERWGMKVIKGEPGHAGYHSVTAVPMLVRDMTFIDRTRR